MTENISPRTATCQRARRAELCHDAAAMSPTRGGMQGFAARSAIFGALALATITAVVTPAHAQGVGAGARLELPELEVSFALPAGVGEWVVRKDDGSDVLQRTKPVNPYLSVLFSAATSDTCADTLNGFAGKGLKKLDKPALVPAGWATQVLSATSGGERLIAFCAESPHHGLPLVALVTYSASLDGPDISSVTPVLEAVGRAYFAHQEKAAAAPAAAPPPAATTPTADADGEPQKLALPRSGLVLLIAGPDEWEAKAGKAGRDLVWRITPDEPALSISLELVHGGENANDCASLLDQYMSTRKGASLEPKPGYLPDEFHPSAAESYDKGSGRAVACAEVRGGFLLASITYSGSLEAEDASHARAVLSAAYLAANTTPKSGKKKRGGGWLSGRSFFSPELYLAGAHTAPASDAGDVNAAGLIDSSTAILLGIRQAGMLRFASGSPFGLAGRYALSGGYDFQNGLTFDGTAAIGFGINIDAVTLMPLVGGGGNAIGAGADEAADKLTLDFDIYNFYGGVVTVEITDAMGLELTGGYLDRGEIRELRFEGQLIVVPESFRKVAVGLAYSDLETVATVWQVLVGVGF
jgi:hypothetical protein